MIDRLIHFRRFLAVGVVFTQGAGIVVVALQIGHKEIGILCFLIRFRGQRSFDGRNARV